MCVHGVWARDEWMMRGMRECCMLPPDWRLLFVTAVTFPLYKSKGILCKWREVRESGGIPGKRKGISFLGQLSELSDRCDKLEQLNLAQQAELTEIKKRFALLEHANVDSLFKKRNKRAKHTNQYPNPTVKVPKRQCSVCRTYGPYGMNCEKSNDRKKCRNFEVDGTPKCQLCIAYREKGSNLNCGKKNVYQIQCKYFEPGGTQKKNESEERK